MEITRRRFTIRLASLLAAAAAQPALGQERPAPGREELRLFRALSARLTGFAEADIDPGLALDMMAGLRAAGQADALDAMLANGGAEPAGGGAMPAGGGAEPAGGGAMPAGGGAEPAGGGVEPTTTLGDAPVAADELARRIAVAWYSGLHPDAGGGVTLRAYQDALVWRALDYTRPPGQCAPAWSEPPAGTESAQ